MINLVFGLVILGIFIYTFKKWLMFSKVRKAEKTLDEVEIDGLTKSIERQARLRKEENKQYDE